MTTIPNRMAFFWHGGPISWMRYMTLSSFRYWNPTWDIQLYSPSRPCSPKTWKTWECDDQDYHGKDYLPEVERLGIKQTTWMPPISSLPPAPASDLFSYEYLGTVGGWYADMDILWCRSMEVINETVAHSDVVLCKTCGVFGVGFLAGAPLCPLWAGVYATAAGGYLPSDYQSCGVLSLHKHAGSAKEMEQRYPGLQIYTAPDETVYPWTFRETHKIFEEVNAIPKNCIGIHWFGGHPDSQEWNKKLTADNFHDFDNTFTAYVRAIVP